jgi:hypothetical protein
LYMFDTYVITVKLAKIFRTLSTLNIIWYKFYLLARRHA